MNPTGHAVDCLRSCYVSQMRFFEDPSILTTIRWYFTDIGVSPLGLDTIFVPSVWEATRDGPLVPTQEVLGTGVPIWSPGKHPACHFIPGVLGAAINYSSVGSSPPDPPLACPLEGVPQAAVLTVP